MKKFFFSLPLICLSFGCATSYRVGVNGYSSYGQILKIQQDSSIYVVADSNATNPILETEIEMKIQKLLNKKGYRIGRDQANYYLLFDYGINSGQTVTETIPIYYPGDYCDYPYSGFYRFNYTTYLPYSTVVYNRWLVLRLFDGKVYRISPKAEPLWIGEVMSTGSNSDLREIINYMLVAAFEHFGQDTGKRVNEFFSEDDERVKFLTER